MQQKKNKGKKIYIKKHLMRYFNRSALNVNIRQNWDEIKQPEIIYITVTPANAITSIKQSLLFKGHLFLSCHRKFNMN